MTGPALVLNPHGKYEITNCFESVKWKSMARTGLEMRDSCHAVPYNSIAGNYGWWSGAPWRAFGLLSVGLRAAMGRTCCCFSDITRCYGTMTVESQVAKYGVEV